MELLIVGTTITIKRSHFFTCTLQSSSSTDCTFPLPINSSTISNNEKVSFQIFFSMRNEYSCTDFSSWITSRKAELLERKRQKKLRQKAKEQKHGEKDDGKEFIDNTSEAVPVPQVETCIPYRIELCSKLKLRYCWCRGRSLIDPT